MKKLTIVLLFVVLALGLAWIADKKVTINVWHIYPDVLFTRSRSSRKWRAASGMPNISPSISVRPSPNSLKNLRIGSFTEHGRWCPLFS